MAKRFNRKKFYGPAYLKGQCKRVTFSDIKKNLIIITTNMNDFSCKEFSNFETPDFEIAMAVRISCCMPGLMRAVNFENNLLVDGDLQKGKPMWSLSKIFKILPIEFLKLDWKVLFPVLTKAQLNTLMECIHV